MNGTCAFGGKVCLDGIPGVVAPPPLRSWRPNARRSQINVDRDRLALSNERRCRRDLLEAFCEGAGLPGFPISCGSTGSEVDTKLHFSHREISPQEEQIVSCGEFRFFFVLM